MRILGIDTATSTASVALLENGTVVAEEVHPKRSDKRPVERALPKSNHAEVILPLIAAALQRAEIGLDDVAGIALSVGPGSFTGVRIGLSTVKGIAYGTRIPTVGISTLHATAGRVTDFDGLICSVLDARKNEVYAALYRKQGAFFERLTQDALLPMAALLEKIRVLPESASCLFVGEGAAVHREMIESSSLPDSRIAAEAGMCSVAAAVARLSEAKFVYTDVVAAAQLAPIYLRRPECEMRQQVPPNSLKSMGLTYVDKDSAVR